MFLLKSESRAIGFDYRKAVAGVRYACGAEKGEIGIFAQGGRDNPLKRFISDKEIQGKQSFFLGEIWL
jgi:hypothetical protein